MKESDEGVFRAATRQICFPKGIEKTWSVSTGFGFASGLPIRSGFRATVGDDFGDGFMGDGSRRQAARMRSVTLLATSLVTFPDISSFTFISNKNFSIKIFKVSLVTASIFE
jgi:hypothetical protein